MANRPPSSLRLSANELEKALREERQKWRIFRLQQVREQARFEASRVRGAVQRRKEAVIQNLQTELLEKWQEDKENEVQQLQREYEECFEAFGKAHNNAKEQPDAAELLAENMAVNREKAVKRGCEAAREQREGIVAKEKDKNRINQMRRSAIRKEKLRASRVAQLPTPQAFVKEKEPVPKPVPTVQLYEHGTLTTTSYVPKNFVIEKELKSTKPSAHQLAEIEENAMRAARKDEVNKEGVTVKKREERGKTALYKERLRQKYRSMLEQLDQAQRDHYLSGFLKGDDHSIFETDEARRKAKLSQQQALELAVERILKDKWPQEREDEVEISATGEGSDLKETTDDSGLADKSESHSNNQQGLGELQEEIRKHRHLVNRALRELHGSQKEISSRGDSKITDDSGIPVDDDAMASQEIRRESSILSQTEPRPEILTSTMSGDVVVGEETSLERDHAQRHPTIPIVSPIDHRLSTVDHKVPMDHRALPVDHKDIPVDRRLSPVEHKMPPMDHRRPILDHRKSRVDNRLSPKVCNELPNYHRPEQANDIHFKETIPAHLMPEKREYERRRLEEYDTTSSHPSSEGTLVPDSSDDIEVKIHFSSDSTSSECTEAIPGMPIRPTMVDPSEQTRKYPGHPSYASHSCSTEYLNLPSCIPPSGLEAYNHNLEKIRQKRKEIQRLLDGREYGRPPITVTPVTYIQEMGSEEGSGRRPLRKRDKFELKKRELLQYYMRKLLDLREDEVMQISASTVEGSGLTVSSLQTLLQSLNISDEDSVFSSQVHLPTSSSSEVPSSPLYPDIDQIPTKLSRSSEIVTPCDLLPNIHRVNNSVHKTCIDTETESSLSSPYVTVISTPVHTHSIENEPESSASCPDNNFLPSKLETPKVELSESPLSTEMSSAAETTPGDIQFEVMNYHREFRILLNLEMIQRLKQKLVAEKINLIKESEELEDQESRTISPSASDHALDKRTTDDVLNSRKSCQMGQNLDGYLHSGEMLRKGTEKEKQTQPPHISRKSYSRTTRLVSSSQEDLVSVSEELESNFVPLKPEKTAGSTLSSTGFSLCQETLRKPVRSLSGTSFRSLNPEDTMKSEPSDTAKTTTSSFTKVGPCTSSSESRKTGDVTKNSRTLSVEFREAEAPSQESEGCYDTDQPIHVFEEDKIVGEMADLQRRSTFSQDSTNEGSSIDQGTRIEKHQISKGNSSESSSNPPRSRKNSSESITSIPDMAEILQRFGVGV